MSTKRKRNYKAEYARRIARAKARGLSRSQARGHPKASERLVSETGARGPTYSAQLEQGLREMREGISLTASARAIGVSRERLKRYLVGAEVVEQRGRRWLPTRSDPRPREMLVYSEGRAKSLLLPDRRVASRAGRYMSAVGRFLESNDTTFLTVFEGQWVTDAKGRKHYFETRPNVLYRLAQTEGETFEQVYRIVMEA